MSKHAKTKKLSAEQNRRARLLKAFAAQLDEKSHEETWLEFQPLVMFVAQKFNQKQGGIHALPGLIEPGNVGLLDALADVAISAGAKNSEVLSGFHARAVPMIHAAMERSVVVQRRIAVTHLRRLELAERMSGTSSRHEQSKLQQLKFLGAVMALSTSAARGKMNTSDAL